jgi:hypothetical protein
MENKAMHLQCEHNHNCKLNRNRNSCVITQKMRMMEEFCFKEELTPRSTFKVNRKFEGTYRLRLTCYLFHDGVFLGLFFDTEEGFDMVLRILCQISTDDMALNYRR